MYQTPLLWASSDRACGASCSTTCIPFGLQSIRGARLEEKVPRGSSGAPRDPKKQLGERVMQVWDPGLSLSGKEPGNMNYDFSN